MFEVRSQKLLLSYLCRDVEPEIVLQLLRGGVIASRKWLGALSGGDAAPCVAHCQPRGSNTYAGSSLGTQQAADKIHICAQVHRLAVGACSDMHRPDRPDGSNPIQ